MKVETRAKLTESGKVLVGMKTEGDIYPVLLGAMNMVTTAEASESACIDIGKIGIEYTGAFLTALDRPDAEQLLQALSTALAMDDSGKSLHETARQMDAELVSARAAWDELNGRMLVVKEQRDLAKKRAIKAEAECTELDKKLEALNVAATMDDDAARQYAANERTELQCAYEQLEVELKDATEDAVNQHESNETLKSELAGERRQAVAQHGRIVQLEEMLVMKEQRDKFQERADKAEGECTELEFANETLQDEVEAARQADTEQHSQIAQLKAAVEQKARTGPDTTGPTVAAMAAHIEDLRLHVKDLRDATVTEGPDQ